MNIYDATEQAFKNGYAKAKAEVAREIFEDIKKLLKDQEVVTKDQRVKEIADWILHNYLPKKVAALEKKFMEGK